MTNCVDLLENAADDVALVDVAAVADVDAGAEIPLINHQHLVIRLELVDADQAVHQLLVVLLPVSSDGVDVW